MPEEVNRVVTDRLSDLLLTPSRDAHPNLLAEGVQPERIVFVGNVMIDSLLAHLPAATELDMPGQFGLEPGRYVVTTIHRPSNVDHPAALRLILEALGEVARSYPVVMPLHPRTRQNVDKFGLGNLLGPLICCPPLGYTAMVSLTQSAAVVLTDSGGLQEETTVLGVPCVTLREQTERPLTLEQGTNRMATWPLTVAGVVDSFRSALRSGRAALGERCPEGWDGRASERIATALVHHAGGVVIKRVS
jgi:UDP-N-acetylglucosamine 2-epimerase (non-hydrolysing)